MWFIKGIFSSLFFSKCVVLFRSFVSITIKACWVILFKADSVYQFTKEIYSVMSEVSAHKITKEKKKAL